MGDLKPIGSEKLTGQEKLNRIMEIARFNEVIPEKINETAKNEYSVNLADGVDYQIFKEKQGYIIKKTISESDADYIEPMKNRKYYSSYSQALKRLNLLAGELNRLNENEEGVSLYGEQKKFVLKTPKPAVDEVPAPAPAAAPPAVPSPELPPSPIGADMGSEEVGPEGDAEMNVDMDSEEMGPEGDVEMDVDMDVESPESDEETVTFKTIQKLTGKLTQKIRTLDNEKGMTSEDIKYVINMVISSLDLKSLSEEDKEDIVSKFEEDSEDFGDLGGDDMDGEDLTDDSEVEDIQADMDIPVEGEMDEEGYGHGAILDHIFGESKVDKVISKYFEVTKKEILENKEKNAKKQIESISQVKRQMKEIVKLTETIEQELASKKFLEENKTAKIVGKTNKKNLVFENKGKQVKISPEGLLV
jgi:hypothetical protein